MTKSLPQGLELAYGPHGLDTVRVSMGFNEALGIIAAMQSQLHSRGDTVTVLLCGWLQECQGEKEHHRRETERLRLLGAVAGAMRTILDAAYEVDGAYSGEWLWEAMAAGREALETLDKNVGIP